MSADSGVGMHDSIGARIGEAASAMPPTLRPAQPGDVPALQRFVNGLSLRTRVMRFFTPLRQLPPGLVRIVAEGDPRHRVLLADRQGEVLALAQQALDPAARRCEVALVVADAWQGRGLGRHLLARLLEDAAAGGIDEARLETRADNGPMQRLARRAGFVLVPHPEDVGLVLGRRQLRHGG